MKKYILLKTTSNEKYEEIRPHFLNYNIECYTQRCNHDPIFIIEEHSELETSSVTSNLIVKNSNEELLKIYTTSANGFLVNRQVNDAWGYDANFIPDTLMISYYDLRKKNLKISPRDMNIGKFLQDYIHYNMPIWNSKNILNVTRPVDLNVDYSIVLYDFFDLRSQTNFTGYTFWKNIIDSAINQGLYLRVSNTRKMNNYWWPVGNAGLPVTKKTDNMHEKTYMMHDIFHFLVPDLLYTTGQKYSEWSYVLHRVMTECFTLVLGDMFYVHYMTINNIVYETVEKRKIYPIFKSIYHDKKDVFTKDILEEVIRASCDYGLRGSQQGFIDLYLKYGNTNIIQFKKLLDEFKNKYDYYLIQDLKWTLHNAEYMKNHSELYEYFKNVPEIIKELDIITLDSLKLNVKQDINYFIDIGLKQLWNSININNQNALKNKFLRWSLGQLCFFEKFKEIPFVNGYKNKFYELLQFKDSIEDTINLFRHNWDQLMDYCSGKIITSEEATHYKEVFPIFDPHYISSYDKTDDDHSTVMNNFLNF